MTPVISRPRRGVAAIWALVTIAFLTACSTAPSSPEGFADLVDRVRPAVINVAALLKPMPSPHAEELDIPPELRGTPFEDFLRRLLELPDAGSEERTPEISLGSGFIVDPAGYVVTSSHVIQNAEKIQITLADGQKLAARLIGRDDETDIALLKVESPAPLPYVAWGDSDKVRVGDWVLAVGNPFGLGGSVTAGVISGRSRNIQSGRFDDYLQIDAPINRGNSGGPSFDRNGRVIGVNSAIFSTSGGSLGIGFAVPSALAQPVVAALREHGHIERGWLGINIQPLTHDIADSLGLGEEAGVLIIGVVPNGPAAEAGLQPGDVIRSVEGLKITQSRDLGRFIGAAAPEKVITLTIWRDEHEMSVRVALGHTPDSTSASVEIQPVRPSSPLLNSSKLLGLSIAPINAETQQRYGLPPGASGALIVGVSPGSPAAEAGVRAGDILARVGNRPINAPGDVEAGIDRARKAGRSAVLFLVQRRGSQRFVAILLSGPGNHAGQD